NDYYNIVVHSYSPTSLTTFSRDDLIPSISSSFVLKSILCTYIFVRSSLTPKTIVPGVSVIKFDNKAICQSFFKSVGYIKKAGSLLSLGLVTMRMTSILAFISSIKNTKNNLIIL